MSAGSRPNSVPGTGPKSWSWPTSTAWSAPVDSRTETTPAASRPESPAAGPSLFSHGGGSHLVARTAGRRRNPARQKCHATLGTRRSLRHDPLRGRRRGAGRRPRGRRTVRRRKRPSSVVPRGAVQPKRGATVIRLVTAPTLVVGVCLTTLRGPSRRPAVPTLYKRPCGRYLLLPLPRRVPLRRLGLGGTRILIAVSAAFNRSKSDRDPGACDPGHAGTGGSAVRVCSGPSTHIRLSPFLSVPTVQGELSGVPSWSAVMVPKYRSPVSLCTGVLAVQSA